ncbi:hypothetical protein LZ30DRAFT_114277 [Colletotrichum cereale]|nr:hypothetical protein LZ30DRAFT_114277 [Colletotrichum cereale]
MSTPIPKGAEAASEMAISVSNHDRPFTLITLLLPLFLYRCFSFLRHFSFLMEVSPAPAAHNSASVDPSTSKRRPFSSVTAPEGSVSDSLALRQPSVSPPRLASEKTSVWARQTVSWRRTPAASTPLGPTSNPSPGSPGFLLANHPRAEGGEAAWPVHSATVLPVLRSTVSLTWTDDTNHDILRAFRPFPSLTSLVL